MPDFQTEVNRLVHGFVAQISTLAREAAIDTLARALEHNGRGGGARVDGGRASGEKRSSDEIDELAKTFREFVVKNPGMRIEQINKQLHTTTKDLMLPIRKLLAEGAIKTKGQRRSTVYFPAGRTKK